MNERILFYILSGLMILFSVLTVTSRRVLRAAIYLLFVLALTGGLYFMLGYHFLGAVQWTVYGGGIAVLIVIAVLLVHDIDHRVTAMPIPKIVGASVVSLLGIWVSLKAIRSFDFQVVEGVEKSSVADVGRSLLNIGDAGFILPFEVISVLLLAVMIAAIIIAKGKNPEKEIES